MTHKPKVMVLSFSDIGRDPRVSRQIEFLKHSCELQVAGFGNPQKHGWGFIPLDARRPMAWQAYALGLLAAKRYESFYWSAPRVRDAWKKLKDQPCDLLLANDINALPIAVRLSQKIGCKLLVDAHEYEPRHFDDQLSFRLLYQPYWDYLCRTYLPSVDSMTTVCRGIAEEYERNYGVECQVTTNAPFSQPLEPSSVEEDRVRMIHHGAVTPSRRLGAMIELMDLLDERFSLDLMLLRNHPREFAKLERMARGNSRIRFRDPVPMNDISKTVNGYDLGIFLLWPAAFSYRLALPNKLFEYIQGRLGIVIWPSPEMARVVSKHGLGIVSDDFDIKSVANACNALTTDDIVRFKQNAHLAAEIENAENNRDQLLEMCARLLGKDAEVARADETGTFPVGREVLA